MRWIALLSLIAVAACGAEGEPVKPFATAGVSIGTGGVSVGGSTGVRAGPVTVSVGF
ncbi:MAG: hypothetical protein AAF092_14875 [Pseudomonadota bacterium]